MDDEIWLRCYCENIRAARWLNRLTPQNENKEIYLKYRKWRVNQMQNMGLTDLANARLIYLNILSNSFYICHFLNWAVHRSILQRKIIMPLNRDRKITILYVRDWNINIHFTSVNLSWKILTNVYFQYFLFISNPILLKHKKKKCATQSSRSNSLKFTQYRRHI